VRPSIALSQDILSGYGRDVLQILLTSLDLSRRGRPEFYRVAALQLRLLLCDSTRRHGEIVNVSLLPRLLPDLRLAPLEPDGTFNRLRPPLPLDAWLDQPMPALMISSPAAAGSAVSGSPGGLTIRYLIRWVCDQDGGAHVDPRRLRFEGAAPLSGRPGPNYAAVILCIAEYVASVLEIRLPVL
jgi:hypothetical protein